MHNIELNRIYPGDALDILRTWPDEFVQCVVTSPPYWGLRDYGVDKQLGLEKTIDEYLGIMVDIFNEVRRVLRKDGTLWLNMGDLFMEKQLVGLPWKFAFALQSDGWWLRSDIIWSKPNPMPESVTDRPTKAHEYLFLLAKGNWITRIVKLSDLASEFVHFSYNRGFEPSDSWPCKIGVGLAASILDFSQFENGFSLSPFDPKVREQPFNSFDGDEISCLPIIHRAAIWAARFLGSCCSSKQFLTELYRLGITLAEGNKFLIGGCSAKFPLPPSFNGDGKATITIHYPGQICNFNILHGNIITQKPGKCNYYYDADAVRESAEYGRREHVYRSKDPFKDKEVHGSYTVSGGDPSAGRNRRTVWTIATQPYPDAHFATFPEALVAPCVMAGTSEKGACEKCGEPWERITEKHRSFESGSGKSGNMPMGKHGPDLQGGGETLDIRRGPCVTSLTTGWQPACECNAETVPCIVFDPFMGSGTVAVVALRTNRRFIGIELNPEYIKLAEKRIDPLIRQGNLFK